MNEKINDTLILILSDLSNIETTKSKIDAAIFVRNNEKLIKEKVAYLYNLLNAESENYNKKTDDRFEDIGRIINKYRKKLNIVYNEIYLQYINIQNIISDARVSQKAILINYQRAVNDSKINGNDNTLLKNDLKEKFEIYDKIIKRCKIQFERCQKQMETEIKKNFLIESSLEVKNENNFIQKIFNKISNFFTGNKRFQEKLDGYEGNIDYINTEIIIKEIREQTIEFVTDILEIKEIDLDEAV